MILVGLPLRCPSHFHIAILLHAQVPAMSDGSHVSYASGSPDFSRFTGPCACGFHRRLKPNFLRSSAGRILTGRLSSVRTGGNVGSGRRGPDILALYASPERSSSDSLVRRPRVFHGAARCRGGLLLKNAVNTETDPSPSQKNHVKPGAGCHPGNYGSREMILSRHNAADAIRPGRSPGSSYTSPSASALATVARCRVLAPRNTAMHFPVRLNRTIHIRCRASCPL